MLKYRDLIFSQYYCYELSRSGQYRELLKGSKFLMYIEINNERRVSFVKLFIELILYFYK
ncbi:hypothetical protein GKR41_00787 [Candidatus Vallotia lariciata]|nr:hypothetical protein GKR41_00787 [Candidatus Vallotia lariciata]